MCHYQQTSPDSHFTQRRICSRATLEGRITLSDMKMIVTARGDRRERLLDSQEEYAAMLREHFGIDLYSFMPPAALLSSGGTTTATRGSPIRPISAPR
ncbi:MAG: arylamine N-acetyltransferase [Anaerolineae bacterium]